MKPLYIKKNGQVEKVTGAFAMPATYPAERVAYDNTNSGLSADDAQGAIDEIVSDLDDKVDKVAGKGLSTNDFTNEDKALIGQTLGNNTVLTTDKTPFLTRQTLNPTGFSGYVREKLIGASYAWNQLITNGNFSNGTTDWTIVSRITPSVSANVLTITINTVGDIYADALYLGIKGHKYLLIAKVKQASTISGTFGLRAFYNGTANYETVYGIKDGAWHTLAVIISETTGGLSNRLRIFEQSATLNDTAQVCDCQCIDLTLAFGSTIADYLYGLSNNGGITKLRDMGCPIDKYTPYGYGLYSVKTSGKLICGFNLWDEEWEVGSISSSGADTPNTDRGRFKNHVPVFEGTTYFLNTQNFVRCAGYDVNKSFVAIVDISTTTGGATITIPSGIKYVRIAFDGSYGATYNHNICLNISDTNKNGTYEPYCGYEISLGNDDLRGKFDLVNGEIVASGDMKQSNGEIDRVYKVADLGSFNWTYDSQSVRFYSNAIQDIGGEMYSGNNYYKNVMFSCYNKQVNNDNMGAFIYANKLIYVYDNRYTDAATFKTAITGQKVQYELATPTTEQSTPFADPMSLVGATTEEYIDTRDIPCPVGAERQYMGQSQDVVEIPSTPQSDGVWVQKCYVSGGKAQYVWELESTS